MSAWRCPVFFGLALFQVVSANAAELTASDWLNKMAEAMSTLSYKGVLVYSHDGALDSMSIYHQVDASGTRERLMSLNGEAREIIRDKHGVRCIMPEDRSVVIDTALTNRLFPAISVDSVDDRNSPYTYQVEGDDRVAGLATVVLNVVPVDAYRYGYKFWLAKETGLLLKTVLLDQEGKAVEQMMFTQIEIGGMFSNIDFYQESSEAGFKTVGTRGSKHVSSQSYRDWKVNFLPPGFHLSAQDRIEFEGQSAEVDHRVYSDGMASVSVYLEPLKEDVKIEGGIQVGAVSAFSAVIGKYQVTVVGELPAKAVRRIAVSVSVGS